jgi:hypothetical protein
MNFRKRFLQYICLVLFLFSASSLRAQTSCTASADAAVQCFVSNAVATKLTKPHHGLTLPQFQAYGVAVLQILQGHHTYLMLIGTASAVADAMPPTNASGTPNQAAQDAAISAIVTAEQLDDFVNIPTGASIQDLVWFAEDIAGAMNDNQGYMQLLTPGVAFRLIDSYVVAATTNGVVDWTKVQSNISSVVDTFSAAGMIKVPEGTSTVGLKMLIRSVAGIIVDYKTATGRKTL